MTQRLWWALLLTVGFWGLLRVAEALGIGTPTSRVIAAAAFALSPRVLTTLGAISSETLPMMLAPWVLLPVDPGAARMQAVGAGAGGAVGVGGRADGRGQRRRHADRLSGRGRSGGPVTGRTGCGWRFTAWWAAVLGARRRCGGWSRWSMLGRISPPFLDFIESSGVTTQWTSLTEMLRGTDSWTPFVAPERHRGRVAGDRVGGGAGHLAGRGGRAGRAGDAHACPRAAGW